MVQALAPNRTNHPLDIGSLPGGSRQQVARKLVKREPVPQLLSGPFRGGMGGHVAVDNATPVVGQDQKHVEYLETEGGDREEINGDDLREMVLEESVPVLRRRFTASDHVLGDAALADVDAELEQFAMNARCTPGGILPAHPADQVPNLACDRWPSGLSVPYLPSPKQAKAFAMPGHNRFRLDEHQRRAPTAPDAG